MLCFALQAATEPGCGESSFVWVQPGDDVADVLAPVCKVHALRLQERGETIRKLRGGR